MVDVTQTLTDQGTVQIGPTTTVVFKPRSQTVRVVQSASPTPVSGGTVADPGDLTLVFDNKLI